MSRKLLTIGLLLLGLVTACSPGGLTSYPTPHVTLTRVAASTSPTSPLSAYPLPHPPTPTQGPYPPPPTPTYVLIPGERPSPTPTHGPSPTKPPPPTPTVTPTWPVIIPSTATPTPQPTNLTTAHLLPRGARLLTDAIADVGSDGAPAAVLIYRWPVGAVLYFSNFDETDLHLRVQPLNGAVYTPQGTAPDSPVHIQVADLNGDGLRDLVVMPHWEGALRFARSGLAAWPRILSATRLQFRGGHLASPVNNMFYFAALHPMLYYAGPKQAAIADVDGDGLWEVDVAYGLEDGADTWQVDRYHWDGQTYVYAKTFTRPAAEPIPPDRYRTMIQALEPLPDFGLFGKGQLPVQKVEVQAQQLVDLDADGDGRPEMLLVYLIHPFYGEPMWDNLPNGKLGLAIFDAADHLVWRSKPESLELLSSLEVAAIPLTLASGESGMLFYRLSVAQGTGAYQNGHMTFYRWDERSFAPVWQRTMASGGGMGACCSSYSGEAIWLEDVDSDGQVEVLLKHIERVQSVEWEYRAIHYLLHLPGVLAFRWDGGAYVPGYFVDGDRIVPIRPRLPVVYAPRFSYPLTVDGDLSDWMQLEYWRSLELKRDWGLPRPWATAVWDEQWLYLTTEMVPSQTLTLALDTDLAGDFGDAALNADDVVLEATLPDGPGCQTPVAVRFRHPPRDASGIQMAAQLLRYGDRCTLELAIPLDALELDGRTLVSAPGWVAGGLDPRGFREYHPQAGQVIGFAVAVDDWASAPGFQPSDPTTWNTLIFMADR